MTEIVILGFLILLNGIFSMSEIAIVSSRRSKLTMASEKGDLKARKALELIDAPNRFLSTVQVGITLISILTGVFGGGMLAESLSQHLSNYEIIAEYSKAIALSIVVFIITFLSLVIGELVPKRIGLNNPEKIAKLIAFPMDFLSKIASPAVWLLSATTGLFIKLLKLRPKENAVTEEEIKTMIKEATTTGEVQSAERDIVENVFFLGDRTVASIMTHKMDVIFLDVNEDFNITKQVISEEVHTNFPIYEDKEDNIIGILNIKKILPDALIKGSFNIRPLLTKPLFVPENLKAYKLMEKFKEANCNFAVVVDEFGSIKGAVTTNDLFKSIMGNLYSNQQEPEITKRDDGSWLVDGLIPFDEFLRFFKIEDLKEEEITGFHTLGGFVHFITKHIPTESEKFTWKDFYFEIMDMDGTRVDKVLIRSNKG